MENEWGESVLSQCTAEVPGRVFAFVISRKLTLSTCLAGVLSFLFAEYLSGLGSASCYTEYLSGRDVGFSES